jgi:hypothetical protein
LPLCRPCWAIGGNLYVVPPKAGTHTPQQN